MSCCVVSCSCSTRASHFVYRVRPLKLAVQQDSCYCCFSNATSFPVVLSTLPMLSWVAWHNDERALGNRRRAVSLSPYELRSLQTARARWRRRSDRSAAAQHTWCMHSARSAPCRKSCKKVAKARATKQCAHRVAPALGRHCHARSLHSASHTCTLLYNTLDTHAERLQVSLVILILHTHVHVHIGATLLGQSCVCCQSARSRATGSRMHARGMFA